MQNHIYLRIRKKGRVEKRMMNEENHRTRQLGAMSGESVRRERTVVSFSHQMQDVEETMYYLP